MTERGKTEMTDQVPDLEGGGACFEALLDWYRKNRRDLPFRRDRDPYHIWVSEIMAQQTRIEAMVPYYERFMTLFPTIRALAEADEDTLHKAWQGLGYYSRVRNLQKTARLTAAAGLPETKEELEKLPGIGPYTAGAIASIAFGQRAAAVDGNVLRVFSRLYDIRKDVMKPQTKRLIEQLVLQAMRKPYGDFTQALMELGALVCTPGMPDCSSCPVKPWCRALEPWTLPVLPEKKKKTEETKRFVLYTDGRRLYLEKRPARGLLAGLYGFPELEPDMEAAAERSGLKLKGYDHVFTHRIWHIEGVMLPAEVDFSGEMHTLEEIEADFAIPTAFQPLYRQAAAILRDSEDGKRAAWKHQRLTEEEGDSEHEKHDD